MKKSTDDQPAIMHFTGDKGRLMILLSAHMRAANSFSEPQQQKTVRSFAGSMGDKAVLDAMIQGIGESFVLLHGEEAMRLIKKIGDADGAETIMHIILAAHALSVVPREMIAKAAAEAKGGKHLN